MEKQNVKNLKPLARKRQQFDNKLLKVQNASDRLSLVHQQIAWCHAVIESHDDTDWSQYCHDWIDVLHDGLASVA